MKFAILSFLLLTFLNSATAVGKGSWEQQTPTNAPPLADHGAFQIGDIYYAYGGVTSTGSSTSSSTSLNVDLWYLSLVDQLNFVELNPNGIAPTPREDHALAVDIQSSSAGIYGDIYLFGGYDTSGSLLDTLAVWEHDVTDIDGAWNDLTPTGVALPTLDHAQSYQYDNDIWIVGGRTGQTDMELYRYSINGDEVTDHSADQSGDVPSPRHDFSGTLILDKYYVFGGQLIASGTAVNDLYIMDTDDFTWELIEQGNTASARYDHSATEYKGYIFIFGGRANDGTLLNDLWYINGYDYKFKELTPNNMPAARAEHSAVSFKHAMWVYGGITSTGVTDELYKYDFPDDLPSAFPNPDFEEDESSVSTVTTNCVAVGACVVAATAANLM